MGFAFCSGYAHMKLFRQKNYYKRRLISLLSLYCNFWIILLLFTLISVATGQADFMPGDFVTFLKTFTTVSVAVLLSTVIVILSKVRDFKWLKYIY